MYWYTSRLSSRFLSYTSTYFSVTDCPAITRFMCYMTGACLYEMDLITAEKTSDKNTVMYTFFIEKKTH